ncbi:MAG: transposase [Streptosporangiaceae bacterium]
MPGKKLGEMVSEMLGETGKAGYAQMLTAGRRFSGRVWAVEGCNGAGGHIAHRLAAGSRGGGGGAREAMGAGSGVRNWQRPQGRSAGAHSVAAAALRSPNLVKAGVRPDLVALGLLAGRRDEPGRARTQTSSRIHRPLLELLPGGAKTFLSAAQARALIAATRPRGIAGQARRKLVAELITELDGTDRKIKACEKEIKALAAAQDCTLLQLPGTGPSSAARLLAGAGNIHRFASRDRFASWNGTGPLDASPGQQQRHRLSRAGHRRINRVRHIMAVAQLRHPAQGRAYYDARKAAGKTSMEAIRCLRRRQSTIACPQMLHDQDKTPAAGPGGHSGTTLQSSVTDLTPDIGSSDKPHPGPAPQSRTAIPAAS